MENSAIQSEKELSDYLVSGCKPAEQWRIGTEHEKFGFNVADLSPVPYEGPSGIETILTGLQEKLGWEPYLDNGKVIALVDKKGGGSVSLEPGGQLELSGAPLENLHQTCRESNAHLSMLRKVAAPMGVGFLGMGASPKWSLEETPRMPKSRYAIMTDYMPKVGSMGLDMMYRTATIQVNLDFASEADMRNKFQIGLKLQPLAAALFASSPFTEGKPNGHLSWRYHIWTDVDNERSGVLPFVFSEDFGFEVYAQWALDVPMYFIIRDEKFISMTHLTFRQFLNDGVESNGQKYEANFKDWDDHLTTMFPDVRIKKYMEMRGADGGPWRRICALPAFWVGLLYDEENLDILSKLTADWTFEEVAKMRLDAASQGLRTKFRDQDFVQLGKQFLAMSKAGLQRRGVTNKAGVDESVFLAPLEEVLVSGRTIAEAMLKKYHSIWQEDINRVFDEYAY